MELLPGDYYLENGRMVFTAQYLRRRGYCCQSGCRHCPYGFRKPAEDPFPQSLSWDVEEPKK